MRTRYTLFTSIISAFLAFGLIGCDDDDGGSSSSNSSEEVAQVAQDGILTLASGTASSVSKKTLARETVPVDGDVSGSVSWDTPGLEGTVILKIGPNEAARKNSIGGTTVSAYGDDGQIAELIVEFNGSRADNVAYTLTQTEK